MKSLARGQLLFVYGTLRRGSNHPMAQHLAQTAEYAGEAQTRGALYWAHEEYPGLTLAGDAYTKGDLYLLPDLELLEQLDDYEGTAYERRRLPVESLTMGPAAAWVYVYLPGVQTEWRIESGDFLLALAERRASRNALAAAAGEVAGGAAGESE